MKRLLLAALFFLLPLSWVRAQGIPFFQNIDAEAYRGHKQNFDIEIDQNGIVYVANFEGLLYYDNAQWRMVYTPHITRVTVLKHDAKGKLWVGGYNFFGYVSSNDRGLLELKEHDSKHAFKGEVQRIWEHDGDVFFRVSNGQTYIVGQNQIKSVPLSESSPAPPDIPATEGKMSDITEKIELGNAWTAVATSNNGIYIVDKNGNEIYHLNEDSGLCSENVTSLAYNGNGLLWGATDNGLFIVQVPSPFTCYHQQDGLKGEVLSLAKMGDVVYAGTQSGLFRQQGQHFEQIGNMDYAVWQLVGHNDHLLAATSNGVFLVYANGSVTHLTTGNTTAILEDEKGFYAGELDGVYYYGTGQSSRKVSNAERVTKFLRDKAGVIWFQNLYGLIWNNKDGQFEPLASSSTDEMSTIVMYMNKVVPISVNSKGPIPYPLFSYTDPYGMLWLTDEKGKKTYVLVNGVRKNKWSELTYSLMDHNVHAILNDRKSVWLGGSNGLTVVNTTMSDPTKKATQQLHIRSFTVNGDHIIWGGHTKQADLLTLEPEQHEILIHYSVDYPSLLLRTQYRYRINGGRWSTWDFDTYTEFNNQPYGNYTFEVQARDAFGRITNTVAIKYEILTPFYRRWYMLLAYLLMLLVMGYVVFKWRLRKLEKAKLQLEAIVQERTAEVVQQKNEIEEKSKNLESALHELSETQNELVRQEKMATVGKLTQGLIDRILNPLNYINNFSKLSEGLVDDARQNIEDEEEHMDSENYEDTIDVLSMLKGNLQKVSQHGASTTRILKAMEEMLKDRSGGIVKTDLTGIIKQNEQMFGTYYAQDIRECHIKTAFTYPAIPVYVKANPELLSKSFMSLLGNSVYAIVKKTKQTQGEAELTLNITVDDEKATIIIRDTGIGIEETIINKIFDPFFTTKTTGEASGTGLYLSREIIQNYGGDITVRSEKNKFTEFTIILPIIKE
jgi:signal transduction histidine kinase